MSPEGGAGDDDGDGDDGALDGPLLVEAYVKILQKAAVMVMLCSVQTALLVSDGKDSRGFGFLNSDQLDYFIDMGKHRPPGHKRLSPGESIRRMMIAFGPTGTGGT